MQIPFLHIFYFDNIFVCKSLLPSVAINLFFLPYYFIVQPKKDYQYMLQLSYCIQLVTCVVSVWVKRA